MYMNPRGYKTLMVYGGTERMWNENNQNNGTEI
jgi:hypothetical protein